MYMNSPLSNTSRNVSTALLMVRDLGLLLVCSLEFENIWVRLSFLGSKAMQKLRSSILGKRGKNLDDVEQMTGQFSGENCFDGLHSPDFCHTGYIESLNSLLLKYANKTYFYR